MLEVCSFQLGRCDAEIQTGERSMQISIDVGNELLKGVAPGQSRSPGRAPGLSFPELRLSCGWPSLPLACSPLTTVHNAERILLRKSLFHVQTVLRLTVRLFLSRTPVPGKARVTREKKMTRESREKRRRREFAELKAKTRESQELVDLAFEAKGGSRANAKRARERIGDKVRAGKISQSQAERMIRDAAAGTGKQSLLKRLLGS
ncbi:MAG: hypothetical protein JWP06_1028 [Candidatus Saccharibacteria bacterium]|nr:hypothetical protein [Candidatus Saccharibacteria bacterium]